jgi:hypothetical protein
MGHPAFVGGVAKTMLRPLDSILNRRVLTQTLLAPEVLLSCPLQSFLQCEATHAPLERCRLFCAG